MKTNRGQATIEYVGLLVMTILFVGFLLAQVDTPIKKWWDKVAMKISAPCPSQACVQKSGNQPTVP